MLADPVNVQVGRRLRAIRRKAGVGQPRLAGKVGVTEQMIQHYETGRSGMTVSRLYAIARALRVSPGSFFLEWEDRAGGSQPSPQRPTPRR